MLGLHRPSQDISTRHSTYMWHGCCQCWWCRVPLAYLEIEAIKPVLFWGGKEKLQWRLQVVTHACNPNTQVAEAGGSWVQDHPGLHSETLLQINKQRSKQKQKSLFFEPKKPTRTDKTIQILFFFLNQNLKTYEGSIQTSKKKSLICNFWLSWSQLRLRWKRICKI
jgi:hypothetical protein